MNQEIWQQLLSLESQDMVKKWFNCIHGHDLNSRRANEINSAAKQAREYFRNADSSSYSVRPLLTFYGVASLGRSLSLLLRKSGGEEGLAGGHGITINNWNSILSGDLGLALKKLESLEVCTCSGLFNDLLNATSNRMSIHVRSAIVDWHVCYNIPAPNEIISLGDILKRLPDLKSDYSQISDHVLYAYIHEISYPAEKEFTAKVSTSEFENIRSVYSEHGYELIDKGGKTTIKASKETFKANGPQFIHTYVQCPFGIPNLYLSCVFNKKTAYSQLCLTYLASYFLGMLVRYFPTQWIALVQGGTGDSLWPTINRLQHYIEESFPKLVIELINDIMDDQDQSD